MLEDNAPHTPPTLSLGEKVGPTLNLEPEPTESLRSVSSTWIVSALFGLIGLTAAGFLIPLSQGQFQAPWSEELRLSLPALWGSDTELEASVQKTNQAAEPAQEMSASEVVKLMEKLNGKYCFNYMPSGDDAVARDAFSKLYWNKLNAELTQLTEDRLDVCSPFAYQTPEVMVGGGCQKSNCGINDVTFYINHQGKIAMDYRVEGECRQASEDGFTQVNLLCSN